MYASADSTTRSLGARIGSIHIYAHPIPLPIYPCPIYSPTQPLRPPLAILLANPKPTRSVMGVAVAAGVVRVIRHEVVLVHTVGRKRHRRDAEAGQGVLVPVPPAKPTCVAPCLAIKLSRVRLLAVWFGDWREGDGEGDALPLPGVVARSPGGGKELAHVEARYVGLLAIVGS